MANVLPGFRQHCRSLLHRLRIPIRVQLSIAITFIIWLTILILSFIILNRQHDQLYTQLVQTGRVSLNYFANSAIIPLIEDDLLSLNKMVKKSDLAEGQLYAIIVDNQGTIRAHDNPEMIGQKSRHSAAGHTSTDGGITSFDYLSATGEAVLELSRPIKFQDTLLGAVSVGMSLEYIDDIIKDESRRILLMSGFIILLGISIAVLLGVGFSRPISKLVLATREIGKGNYTHRTSIARNDEFGDLATAFNFMAEELRNKFIIQQSFGRYVSKEVLDMILSNPDESWLKGAKSTATVLFTDIRNFTKYAEEHDPELVVEHLNECFEIATEAILENGGSVDKFIGDAVLGVFGIPIQHEDHARRAVDAAFAIQEKSKKQLESGSNALLGRIGISITSGLVVSGNIGSQVKMEYTVIGDTVNVASRLNNLAGPGEIIIGRSVYDAVQDLVQAEELPPQQLKGKSELVEVFRVVGVRAEKDSDR